MCERPKVRPDCCLTLHLPLQLRVLLPNYMLLFDPVVECQRRNGHLVLERIDRHQLWLVRLVVEVQYLDLLLERRPRNDGLSE